MRDSSKYNIGEKPTIIIMCTNRHAGNKPKQRHKSTRKTNKISFVVFFVCLTSGSIVIDESKSIVLMHPRQREGQES